MWEKITIWLVIGAIVVFIDMPKMVDALNKNSKGYDTYREKFIIGYITALVGVVVWPPFALQVIARLFSSAE